MYRGVKEERAWVVDELVVEGAGMRKNVCMHVPQITPA
jgi:hypothetical protein